MKKKIISVLAVLAMLVFACGTAFSAEFSIDLKGIKDTIKKDVKNAKSGNKQGSTTGTAKAAAANTEPNSEDDFDWKVNNDFTEITITKYKGERKDVVIPATIQDVPVTRIGNDAFHEEYDYTITSVVIPEGVKEIGKGAFGGCRKLESVTLPEGFKIIPDKCFWDCKSLANISFPSTLKYIGNNAFDCNVDDRCPLTSVELPEGLEYIGYQAFESDTITSVSLPKSLKWIYITYNNDGPEPIIKSNNISTITIAEGCAPKVIRGKEGMDGRDIIKGASIEKSLKLQKQLAALKLTPADSFSSSDSKYKKNGIAYKNTFGDPYFTDTGKALYDDLLKYGFSEKEAKKMMGF